MGPPAVVAPHQAGSFSPAGYQAPGYRVAGYQPAVHPAVESRTAGYRPAAQPAVGSQRPEPQPAVHPAGESRTAAYRPAAATGGRRSEGQPAAQGPARGEGAPPAEYGGPVHRPAPYREPGSGGVPQLPPWVIVRPAVRSHGGRRLAWVWAAVVVGTAVATVVDRVAGGLDGRPALFLLVVLALPFWDGLPARISTRLLELGAVTIAVAAVWLVLAALRPEGWWRGEIAYGLAGAIVGTVHALLTRRRTVDT